MVKKNQQNLLNKLTTTITRRGQKHTAECLLSKNLINQKKYTKIHQQTRINRHNRVMMGGGFYSSIPPVRQFFKILTKTRISYKIIEQIQSKKQNRVFYVLYRLNHHQNFKNAFKFLYNKKFSKNFQRNLLKYRNKKYPKDQKYEILQHWKKIKFFIR